MDINKIKAYLGFAINSGKVVFGYDNVKSKPRKNELIIICSTLSDKVTTKLINFATEKNYSYIKLTDLILGDLIHRDNCKVIAVIDVNLATAIKKEYN